MFSSASGQTYWVRTEAPRPTAEHPQRIGSRAELVQHQTFRKTAAGATMKIVVTASTMELIDPIGGQPTEGECPWLAASNVMNCKRILTASTSFDVDVFWYLGQKTLMRTGGSAELNGWQGAWDNEYIYTRAGASVPLWSAQNFELERDVDVNGGRRARMRLRAPIVIDVPLGEVGIGHTFSVFAQARASASSRRFRPETPGAYAFAYFRDPAQTDGVSIVAEGVEEIDPPAGAVPAPGAPAGARACNSGPDAAAGSLHFASAGFAEPEVAGDGAAIVVTRSGGSRGAVSALLRTADGSGLAGVDYRPVALHVQFADGEAGSKMARVPVIGNTVAAPNKTVLLTLSEPGGCASVSEPSTAVLTILDDDTPPAVTPRFSIGGTVTGLQGTGLLLRSGGSDVAGAPGPFTFPTLLASGAAYEVTVARQPVAPLQICTVANGRGTVAGANVTDVRVDCRTPAANGALDPSFGDGGKVSSGLSGGGRKAVLQPDGRLLVLGRRTLVRYTVDGRLDAGFGNAGQVVVDLGGSSQDEAQGLALQADGRIVVVGSTRVGASDDMAVARYDAQGRLDTGFGDAGRMAIDFSGGADRAWNVLVQPDGRLVVAGHAGMPAAIGTDNDYAAARLTPSGRLDTSFGSGGKVTTNIAGRSDLAFAAALQPDGRIVLAGRVADAGGDFEDFGLVRYTADGRLDASFGNGGRVRVDFSVNRLGDQALDLAIQPDGRIVVAGFAAALVDPSTPARSVFAVARFLADGRTDATFGRAGVVLSPFSTANDFGRALALQADGRIVVAGQRSNELLPDFAVARYLTDGAPDPTFGNGGLMTIDFFGGADDAHDVLVQPDGKLVVVGQASNGAAADIGLARILP